MARKIPAEIPMIRAAETSQLSHVGLSLKQESESQSQRVLRLIVPAGDRRQSVKRVYRA